MKTVNHITIHAPLKTIFSFAADIGNWPAILPHYRWVKILNTRPGDDGKTEVVAEMAARHRGVPLWWKTVQVASLNQRSIRFRHIGGITKGMDVEWRFSCADDDSSVDLPREWLVEIYHDFSPPWPTFLGTWFAETIVGELFVHQVAGKTLRKMKELSQAS